MASEKNRSTIDGIFIIKQISEKFLEFNKPAYMCFVDVTKAFDRVRFKDALGILRTKELNHNLCRTKIKLEQITTN